MEAKETIKQLFEIKKIKSVIYVDDEFSLDSYKDNLFGYIHSRYDKGVEFPFLHIDEKPSIDVALNSWWTESDDKSKEEKISEYAIEPTITGIAKKIYNLLPTNILKCLSPDIFLSSIEKIQGTVNPDNQALILMDQELNSKYINGDRLLSDLENKEYFSCGIFSNTFTKDEEIQQWEKRKYKKNVYPLSKKRFDEEEKNIIEGLRNVLWLKQISDIKDKTTQLIKASTEYTINELNKIDPASFDHAVIERSREEGCWEFLTLQRIIMILLNQGAHDEIKDKYFNFFQKNTKMLRNISDVSKTKIKNNELLKKLRKSEQLIEGEYINQIFSPIENGDIFELEGKKYILLYQPCNISIRKDGKRSRGLNQAYLLPIEEKDLNHKLRNDIEAELVTTSEQKHIVCFNKNQVVCLSVMDLVSFNSDGIAKINIEEKDGPIEGGDIMQPNMIKRYKYLRKVFERYTNAISIINDFGDKEKESKNYLKKVFEIHLKWEPEIENKIVDFKITRINRYNEFHSQILLQKFMGYLSRPGLPNDISEMDDETINR